jgi:Tol biopolymer transport system component
MRIAGAGLVVICALLRLPVRTPDTLITVPQADPWRSTSTPASVSVSADGRFVALTSYARLVAADTDRRADIYVLDRLSGRVTLESVAVDDRPIEGDCDHPRLSGDGRFLAFQAAITNGEGLPDTDVVVRDRVRDTATRVSRDAGRGGPRWSGDPEISEDGRVVVFRSAGTDLVPGRDENGSWQDVYAFDPVTRAVRRVSVDSRGAQHADGAGYAPAVSGNGRYVAFTSTADLEGSADRREPRAGSSATQGPPQVYVRDMELGITTRASSDAHGKPLDGGSFAPSISRDGRYVAFGSTTTKLAEGDRNRSADVFLRDLHSRTTVVVSRSANGGTANGQSRNPAISGDGRFVAFQSEASDLVCFRCPPALLDVNLLSDVFLFDRTAGLMTWVSAVAAGGWPEESGAPQLDADGSVVAFTSRHPIDQQDTRNDFDLFVHVQARSSAP